MTTRERAEKVKATLIRVGIIDQRNPMNEVAAVGILETALKAAEADEREACAKIADGYMEAATKGEPGEDDACSIAYGIRKRVSR